MTERKLPKTLWRASGSTIINIEYRYKFVIIVIRTPMGSTESGKSMWDFEFWCDGQDCLEHNISTHMSPCAHFDDDIFKWSEHLKVEHFQDAEMPHEVLFRVMDKIADKMDSKYRFNTKKEVQS